MNTAAKVVIVGFGVLLAVGMCQNSGTTATPVEPAAPEHHVQVLSIACDPNYTRPRADIAVRNIGHTTIEYPKVLVSFAGQMHDGYLDPRPLRSGGTATATVYANHGASVDCSLVSVTDREGFAANLAR